MADAAAPLPPYPSEAEINEVLAEVGAISGAVIAGLLQDLATLACDYERLGRGLNSA